eukprot:13154260-Alexandrium_andersonii.AAC.1
MLPSPGGSKSDSNSPRRPLALHSQAASQPGWTRRPNSRPGLQGVDALLEAPHLLVDGGGLALDALGDGGALLLRASD